jgi:hypothetical protein
LGDAEERDDGEDGGQAGLAGDGVLEPSDHLLEALLVGGDRLVLDVRAEALGEVLVSLGQILDRLALRDADHRCQLGDLLALFVDASSMPLCAFSAGHQSATIRSGRRPAAFSTSILPHSSPRISMPVRS